MYLTVRRSVSSNVKFLTHIFRSHHLLHFESKVNRDLMGNLVKDMGKMVGLDTGDRKLTKLIVIKRSLVASVVLHIVLLLILSVTQGRRIIFSILVQGVL